MPNERSFFRDNAKCEGSCNLLHRAMNMLYLLQVCCWPVLVTVIIINAMYLKCNNYYYCFNNDDVIGIPASWSDCNNISINW